MMKHKELEITENEEKDKFSDQNEIKSLLMYAAVLTEMDRRGV